MFEEPFDFIHWRLMCSCCRGRFGDPMRVCTTPLEYLLAAP